MRKLTVKNFSVIKEAELEFGKITVLIGPQASGKSLLCKLAYFFGKEMIELAIDAITSRTQWEDFKEASERGFRERFSTDRWLDLDSSAEFVDGYFRARVFGQGDPSKPTISLEFSRELTDLYAKLLSEQAPVIELISLNEQFEKIASEINLLLTIPFARWGTYIPAGRAFFINYAKGIAALQNPDLDPIVRKFATQVTWDSRWKIGSY
jgi:hypothetical protein